MVRATRSDTACSFIDALRNRWDNPRYTASRPSKPARTVYVQQQQVPGGWQDHAETADRAIATARYKAFARDRGTRLIERTERVLVEELAGRGKKRPLFSPRRVERTRPPANMP